MLRSALDGHGLDYEAVEGEAAFYGPKIDLQVTDSQGREEARSTAQGDFTYPPASASPSTMAQLASGP
ncbi:MAG: hypothetical protein ACYDAQ_16425 [Mycobacteriales bacterium]